MTKPTNISSLPNRNQRDRRAVLELLRAEIDRRLDQLDQRKGSSR